MGLNRAALERLRLMLGDADTKEIEKNATVAERIEQHWLAELDKLLALITSQTLDLTEKADGRLTLPADLEEQLAAFFLHHEVATVNAAASTAKHPAHVEAEPHARMAKSSRITYQTRAVLAGAYKANAAEYLTHTVEMPSEEPLCNRVKASNIADEFASDVNAAPTCSVCLGKDPRFKKTVAKKTDKPLPRTAKAVKEQWDEYKKSGKLPPHAKKKAAQVKALYIKKVQELWKKNTEDFVEGNARLPSGEWNPDAFDKEKARKEIQKVIGVSRARARTIVETETTRYYNDTRREFYDEIETVEGYLFVAVRDSATTKWCRSRTGLVFFKGSVLLMRNTPPCHWNCRSELLPLSRLNPTHKKILDDMNLWASKHKLVPLPPGWNA